MYIFDCDNWCSLYLYLNMSYRRCSQKALYEKYCPESGRQRHLAITTKLQKPQLQAPVFTRGVKREFFEHLFSHKLGLQPLIFRYGQMALIFLEIEENFNIPWLI